MNKKSAAQILMVNNDATFDQIKYNYSYSFNIYFLFVR